MKTIEEFLKEIAASKELQEELNAIKGTDALAEFLKKHDCGASAKDFKACVESQSEGEIDDDDAEAAAGGRQFIREINWTYTDEKDK